MNARKVALAWALLLIVAVLASCPNPIDQAMVITMNDSIAPVITITSPDPGTGYANTVTVTGTIMDSAATANDGRGGLAECGWELYQSVRPGTPNPLDVDDDGTFVFTADTRGLTAEISIDVIAKDTNGNVTVYTIDLTDDGTGPAVSIETPSEGAGYPTTVQVAGVASNRSDSSATDEISRVWYSVLGSDIGDELFSYGSADFGGSFGFEFSTITLSGNITVQVSAEDFNGNVTSASVTLQDYGSDIPSFSATPGTGAVTLSWDPVPHTTRYNLYYTTNGTLPSEDYGTEVAAISSPYTLTGVDNGALHVLRLKAVPEPGYTENWSDYVRCIPLSGFTLMPEVRGGFGEIELSWPEIPAVTAYEVHRSASPDGGFINITGAYSGTTFTDTEVQTDEWYSYRVYPSGYQQIASAAASATPDPVPPAPYIRTTLDTAGFANSVANSGDYLVLADGTDGVKIVDVSDPTAPEVVNEIPMGNAYAVEIAGSVAYVADRHGYLHVIDISFPATAGIDKSVEIGGEATGLCVASGMVYVTAIDFAGTGDSWISEVDVDPVADAYETRKLARENDARYWDVELSGSYLMVANGQNAASGDAPAGYLAVSISNGSIRHEVPTTGARAITVDGYVYLADGESGLRILSMTHPENAAVLNTIDTPYGAVEVTMDGDYAFVSDANAGMQVIDVGSPASAFIKESLDTSGQVLDIVVDGNVAFLADQASGIQVVDISSPVAATAVKTVNTDGNALAAVMRGPYVYVADQDAGVAVIDATQPSSAVVVETKSTGYAMDIELAGDHAFVADVMVGVVALDISEPTELSVETSFGPPAVEDVELWSHYLIASVGGSGVQIYDVADLSAVELIRTVDTPGQAQEVAVAGEYAVVADFSNTLQIISLADPSAAAIVETHALSSGSAYGLGVAGDYAYIAKNTNGVEVLDISELPTVSFVASFPDPPNAARDVAVAGSYAYVADGNAGVRIYDVSDLQAITRIRTVPGTGYTYGVSIAGRYAIASDADAGVILIDLLP